MDDLMINYMLSRLGLDRQCAAMKLKEVGDACVDSLFAGDSHTSMRTHFLRIDTGFFWGNPHFSAKQQDFSANS
jgi:hypothetical protein